MCDRNEKNKLIFLMIFIISVFIYVPKVNVVIVFIEDITGKNAAEVA